MNAATPIAPPEVPATTATSATAELNALLARANAVQVTNVDEYAAAVQVCANIAQMKSRRQEERLVITRKMDAAKQAVMDFFAGTFLTPLEKVDVVIRGKLKAYDAYQKRIADERRRQVEAEAARARAETERKAREEREVAAQKAAAEKAEADRKRQEAEHARKAEEEARAAGDAAAAKAAADNARTLELAAIKSQQQAERIAEKGFAKADALEQRAAEIVAPVVTAQPTAVAGKAKRTVWKYRITDPAKIDRKFLAPDESKIGATVRALKKDAADVVGGIEVWDEDDLTIRGSKT